MTDEVENAGASLARVREDRTLAPAAQPRTLASRERTHRIATKVTAAAFAELAIVVLTAVIGLTIGPIGMFGALAVLLLMVLVPLAIAFAPIGRAPNAEMLKSVDIRVLPQQTGRWLEAQRPALPAPAIPLVDQISRKLDLLTPQLAGLPEHAPAADEIRKLVGEQLPEFVRGYARVPQNLRAVPRNGKTPDAELVDGLGVIDREIAELSAELAQGDLDGLATRGRFLEIKYQNG